MKTGSQTSTKQTALLVGSFVLICGITIFNHEMWRDEASAWLMSRESSSLWELLKNSNYTGHPRLWNLLLFPIAKFFPSSPFAMQIFNLIVVTTAVWIFIHHSPFDNLHKFLFVFGYLPIYEYSVVARPYGLSLLFMFLFCLLFPKRKERFLTLSLVVFLLSNSSPVGLVAGGACLGLLVFDTFLVGDEKLDWRKYTGFAFIIFGILIGLASMISGTQSGLYEFRTLDFKTFLKPYRSFAESLFLFPREFIRFFIGKEAVADFRVWFDILAFPSACYVTIRFCKAMVNSAHALSFYLLGNAGLFILFTFFYSGSLRHHGFFFILLISALWICATIKKEILKPTKTALTVMLSAHLLAGVIAVASDSFSPFSNGKRTAEFIKKEGLNEASIVAYPGAKADAIMAYMEKGTEMFYPTMGRFVSFYDLGPQTLREEQLSMESVFQAAQDISRKSNRQTLLILNREVNKESVAKYKLVKKGAFVGSIKGDESFYLYGVPSDSRP